MTIDVLFACLIIIIAVAIIFYFLIQGLERYDIPIAVSIFVFFVLLVIVTYEIGYRDGQEAALLGHYRYTIDQVDSTQTHWKTKDGQYVK